MTAPITITVAGADDFAATIIAHAVGNLLREHGVTQFSGVHCGANPLDFDLSSYAVNVVRAAPAPPAATFGVTGPPVSEMSAEIRSRIIAMGIEPRRVSGVHVHPSSGLLKVRHRPLYMREAVLGEETAEEYAAWKAAKSKAKPEASDAAGLTVTIAGSAGERKTRFGEYLLRALSDYGPALGKTQDMVEQNIRRFRDADETNSPVYVGQFEGSPLRIGTHGGDGRRSSSRQDLTIRELQTSLPWTVRYSADFRANPQSHKDFAHALLHIQKASGALAAFVDDMDHRRETADEADTQERYGKYLADMVVCALRLANTFPGGVLDLQRAVEDRLESKNSVTLPRPVA